MIDHTVDYMVKQGWKQVAFMGLEDSYGEGGWVEFADRHAQGPGDRRRRALARRHQLHAAGAARVAEETRRGHFTPSRPRRAGNRDAAPRRLQGSGAAWRRLGHAGLHGGRQEGGRRRAGRHLGPCPCIASCPTTIRSSPASPRSCRPMTASTAPARPTCSRPRPTTRCRSRCWPIASGGRRQAADLTQARLAARRHRGDARVSRRQRPVQLQPDRPPGPGPAQHLPGDGQGRQVRTAG